jgi:septum site-determining protein MinC
MKHKTKQIAIKGIRDGILINLDEEASLDTSLQALETELVAQKGFLRGSRVILFVGRREMSKDDIVPFQELLAGHEMTLWTILASGEETREAARALSLATRLPGSNADLNGNSRPAETGPNEAEAAPTANGQANALVLRETLRSGRSVYHDGHVAIIGDVNPGAEVIAGGDVIVWGKVRGLVHAGAHGDSSAVICALALTPTQLRIADQIAVAPGDLRRQPMPEKAMLVDGQIVAEPWDNRR